MGISGLLNRTDNGKSYLGGCFSYNNNNKFKSFRRIARSMVCKYNNTVLNGLPLHLLMSVEAVGKEKYT